MVGKSLALFGGHDRERLAWFSISLGGIDEVDGLLARITNRLRNTIDRERRRRSYWERLEIAALFQRRDDAMTLEGFVHFGEVRPQEFVRALSRAWSMGTVCIEPFSGESTSQSIQDFGARWHGGAEIALTSLRKLRLTVGPRWAKGSRHWSPVSTEPLYLEPLPICIGYGDLTMDWRPW